MRRVATLVAALALGIGALGLAACSPADVTLPALQPCATEDSPGPCYWDAQARGNGAGRSFTVDLLGVVTYL